jgi:hypothetical protein
MPRTARSGSAAEWLGELVDERVAQGLHMSPAMSRCLLGALGMLVAVAGCTDAAECKRAHRVVSSDGNEPGTLRVGTVFQAAFPAIAPMSDGSLVCLTCSGFVVMEPGLDVQYEGGKPPYGLAVGSDDTIYAVQVPGGYKADVSGTSAVELAAFEPGGAVRWTSPLPGGFARPLVAVPQGVYVETIDGSLSFFAATTGERRAMPSQALLAADRAGPFTSTLPNAFTRAPEATIRRLDTTGATTWERTWRAPTEGVLISAAVATPEGGLIVAGSALEPIDFGDRTLSGSDDGAPGSFLVALDASGATLWAYALPALESPHQLVGPPGYLALRPSGDVLLAGALFTNDLGDAYLAVATATGVLRTHRIDGAADQLINGLASGPDGIAWLEVANEPREGESDAEMHLGGQTFQEPDIYVFAIVP